MTLKVKGIKNVENRFENLKKEGDEAFKMKNYKKSHEVYSKTIQEMEQLDQETFRVQNRNSVYDKSN